MNIKKIRKDFPFFTQPSMKDGAYLDSAATSQKPESVINAIADFYRYENANPFRGIHSFSEIATEKYEAARKAVADFIGAEIEEIIFTAGTTAGVNFIAETWAKKHIKNGDEIVLTEIEHHANLLPWQRLAQEQGAILRFIPLNKKTYTLEIPEGFINKKTKLVAVTHVSNVLGNVWEGDDLEKLITRAHEFGARIFIDAAQSVPHRGFHLSQIPVDFAVFSPHKMLGPMGIGVLYIKKELHDETPPYQLGGSMVYSTTFEKAIWQKAPKKFEAGTPPVAQAIGLHKAIEYLSQFSREELQNHETSLCKHLLDGLSSFSGATVLGNEKRMREKGSLISFIVDGVHAHDIAAYLGQKNIAVRAGHHCAQPLATLLETDSSLRASFYLYTTRDDIDRFLEGLKEAVDLLRV